MNKYKISGSIKLLSSGRLLLTNELGNRRMFIDKRSSEMLAKKSINIIESILKSEPGKQIHMEVRFNSPFSTHRVMNQTLVQHPYIIESIDLKSR